MIRRRLGLLICVIALMIVWLFRPTDWAPRDLVVALLDKRDADFEGADGAPWKRILDMCPTNTTCIHLATQRFGSTSNWETILRRASQPQCSSNCQIVSDSHQAHALLFHIFDVPSRRRLRRMHATRPPGQVWIMYSIEPPIHVSTSKCYHSCDYPYIVSATLSEAKELVLPSYLLRHYPDTTEEASFFNWTITYRRDATFYSPYASFGRLPEGRLNPTPTPSELISKKRHLAFAVVSNCHPYNRRQEILHELESVMDLHIYGRCGSKRMDPGETISSLSQQYYFYLSFENSFCKDYITEKFYNNGLNGHAVPVAFGGISKSEYEAVAPPHSYIYAGDFPTAAALAKALRTLAASPTEYAKYQHWKATHAEVHRDTRPETNLFCSVCQKLKSDARKETILDLNRFFNTGVECRQPNYYPFVNQS